jgi:hypothetical protein
MKNFFFAPSKMTVESPEILAYLQSIGNVKFALANSKENSALLKRLKNSETRSDVSSIACILTAPTDNRLLEGDTKLAVGRGITDIGDEALFLDIPTFICRRLADGWGFYRVLTLTRVGATGNWKSDFSHAVIEPVQLAADLF